MGWFSCYSSTLCNTIRHYSIGLAADGADLETLDAGQSKFGKWMRPRRGPNGGQIEVQAHLGRGPESDARYRPRRSRRGRTFASRLTRTSSRQFFHTPPFHPTPPLPPSPAESLSE